MSTYIHTYILVAHFGSSCLCPPKRRRMVCARCDQWVENQWLFWSHCPSSLLLPPDVQFVSPGPWYFFCARCTIAKYENEGWTPGSYQNEDGNESTDDEDEHFLCVHLPYCRLIISSPAASYETAEETGPVSVSHVRPCDSQNKRDERMRMTAMFA